MRALRQFGALVLVLASCLSPAMACMIPDAPMTPEERACCRMMGNQCGEMEMPASRGCCQKTSPNAYENALDTKAVASQVLASPVTWLAAPQRASATISVIEWVELPDYSPPNSPPSTISVLRI